MSILEFINKSIMAWFMCGAISFVICLVFNKQIENLMATYKSPTHLLPSDFEENMKRKSPLQLLGILFLAMLLGWFFFWFFLHNQYREKNDTGRMDR